MPADGRHDPVRQAGGRLEPRRGAARAPGARRGQDRARRDARPVRDRAPARARGPRHADRALHPHAAQDLRDDRALRRDLVDRRSRRRDRPDRQGSRRTRRRCPRARCSSARPRTRAIRIAGVRAYERARRGEEVEMPERVVHVHRFEQLWREDGERGGYEIECGSGTYIRSLVADLGDAYCESLRRTHIGPWSVDAADGETLIPLADVLRAFLPVVAVEGEQARRARHGALVDVDGAMGTVVLADDGGPDLRRGAPRRRRRQGVRRVPRVKVTRLPDAEPRPRRLAVGTFDGVHLGHREVIRGADTVLTFDPHPSAVVSPHGSPPLLTTLERKAELIEGLGVEELVVIPFDKEFASRSAAEIHRRGDRRGARRHARERGGELPLRPQGAGRHRHAGCRRALRDARGAAAGDRRRGGQLVAHPRARPGRRGHVRRPAPRRAVRGRRARSCTATSAAASWASRPPTWFPQRLRDARPRRLRLPRARRGGRAARPSTSACARRS